MSLHLSQLHPPRKWRWQKESIQLKPKVAVEWQEQHQNSWNKNFDGFMKVSVSFILMAMTTKIRQPLNVVRDLLATFISL